MGEQCGGINYSELGSLFFRYLKPQRSVLSGRHTNLTVLRACGLPHDLLTSRGEVVCFSGCAQILGSKL